MEEGIGSWRLVAFIPKQKVSGHCSPISVSENTGLPRMGSRLGTYQSPVFGIVDQSLRQTEFLSSHLWYSVSCIHILLFMCTDIKKKLESLSLKDKVIITGQKLTQNPFISMLGNTGTVITIKGTQDSVLDCCADLELRMLVILHNSHLFHQIELVCL